MTIEKYKEADEIVYQLNQLGERRDHLLEKFNPEGRELYYNGFAELMREFMKRVEERHDQLKKEWEEKLSAI